MLYAKRYILAIGVRQVAPLAPFIVLVSNIQWHIKTTFIWGKAKLLYWMTRFNFDKSIIFSWESDYRYRDLLFWSHHWIESHDQQSFKGQFNQSVGQENIFLVINWPLWLEYCTWKDPRESTRPVARIDGGGRIPQNVDLLNPISGLFEPHSLTNTPFFAHFVANSGHFGRFGGCVAPPSYGPGKDNPSE